MRFSAILPCCNVLYCIVSIIKSFLDIASLEIVTFLDIVTFWLLTEVVTISRNDCITNINSNLEKLRN